MTGELEDLEVERLEGEGDVDKASAMKERGERGIERRQINKNVE